MPRRNSSEQDAEDWIDECDQDEEPYEFETEEQRKSVYNNMCSDEDDAPETVDYVNERYKRRIIKSVIVNLPTMASDVPTACCEGDNTEDTPKLNLPSGGWAVKNIVVSDIASDMPSLSESKLKQGKKKFAFSREGEWKKMTNFFSDPVPEYCEPPPKLDDEFVKVEKKSRERIQRPPQQFEVPHPQSETPRNLKCTKMCNAGEGCRRRSECNYAHTMEEFNPVGCRFQGRCKNVRECKFKHDFETKEAYLDRIKALPRDLARK